MFRFCLIVHIGSRILYHTSKKRSSWPLWHMLGYWGSFDHPGPDPETRQVESSVGRNDGWRWANFAVQGSNSIQLMNCPLPLGTNLLICNFTFSIPSLWVSGLWAATHASDIWGSRMPLRRWRKPSTRWRRFSGSNKRTKRPRRPLDWAPKRWTPSSKELHFLILLQRTCLSFSNFFCLGGGLRGPRMVLVPVVLRLLKHRLHVGTFGL